MDRTHERPVTARNGLNTLIKRGRLLTFLDPELTADSPIPSTNNRHGGGVNAPLRDMLRLHRGMSTLRRVKAVFWWCHMQSECPRRRPRFLRRCLPTATSPSCTAEPLMSRRREKGRRWPDLGGAASLVALAHRLELIIRQHVLAYNPRFFSGTFTCSRRSHVAMSEVACIL